MDMQKLMQQANAMQRKMKKVQEELEATEYTGTAGGSEGVSIRINGKDEVQEVTIADELCSAENKEELQDLILIAFNNAIAASKQDQEEKMGAVTQGMHIPGMQ